MMAIERIGETELLWQWEFRKQISSEATSFLFDRIKGVMASNSDTDLIYIITLVYLT
jgi:hypothetical protein